MIGKHVVIDTLDNFKAKLDQIPSSAIVLIKDVGQIYAHGTYFGAQKTYSLLTKTADGLAPHGGTSASSQISNVDTEWVLTVTNGENPTWRKLPANAFNSSSYTLSSATTSYLGGIKVGQVYTATFDDLVGQYYKINVDKNGLAYVHVPWVNNPYTASGSGITLKDNVFSLSLNSVTKLDQAIGNKIYAVSLDKNGKLCVSVPWTDTNNIFVGATETKNGSSGMVPAPIANQHRYFLRGDGTWVKPNLSDLNDDVVNGKYLPKASPVYTGILSTKEPGSYQEAETLFFRNASNTADYGTQIINNWNDGSSKTTRFVLDKTGVYFIDVNGSSKTIYHSGNFNPSDYLPLTGGELSNSYEPLIVKRLSDTGASFIRYHNNEGLIGTIGVGGSASSFPYDIYFQHKSGSSYKIWHEGNDGSGSGLDADTLDGYHASYENNRPWGTIPVIHNQGWIDIGRQIAFHYDNTTGSNYSTLLQTSGNNSNIVTLPSTSGTLALTSQLPNVTDYYWANIKVSTTSNTGTSPTFNLINTNQAQVNNYIFMNPSGEGIYLKKSSLHWHNKGTYTKGILYFTKDGLVGIGTTPSWKLDVSGTFNSSNYQVGGALELKTNDTACQTTVFGSNNSGYRMRIVRQSAANGLNTNYSPTLVLSSLDTHAYFAWDYGSSKAWIGAGSDNRWTWRSELITSDNIGSQQVDKSIRLKYATSAIGTKDVLDGFLEANTFKAALWDGDNTEAKLGTSYPGASNGTILSGGYSSSKYGFQLAIDDDPNWFMALRQRGNGTWAAWKRIPMGDGTGASGTWSINITGSAGSAGNADTLDSQHGDWYRKNVLGFTNTGYSASNEYNCNTLKDGIIYNYGSASYWKNGPSGMRYGQVLNLRRGDSYSLMGQLAWDVNHASTTDTTRYLWWRASDDGSLTEAKWHQIAFKDTKVDNATNADVATSAGNADTVDNYHASSLVKFYLSPLESNAPAASAKTWFTNTMPSSSGAIVYNVPGSEKTIIVGKSSGSYGHMLQLNYDDTYLRILRYVAGSWKSTDWEKISAGYADSAGNADTIDSYHISVGTSAGTNSSTIYFVT